MNFNLYEHLSENNTSVSKFPAQTPLVMAYVPFQTMDEIYETEKGFNNGTIFPELNFPFCGREGVSNGNKG